MITYEDPLRGLLFYSDLGFSHTLRKETCVPMRVMSLLPRASGPRERQQEQQAAEQASLSPGGGVTLHSVTDWTVFLTLRRLCEQGH